MPVKTYAEQLLDVQEAIYQIEKYGQSYTVQGLTYNRANLADLYKREEFLRVAADREANSSTGTIEFIRGVFG